MQDLIETYHNPLTQDNSVKIQDTRFEKYLNISIPDQLFKNQCTSVNNMFFKNYPMQQSTQNQVYQAEDLINQECDQFIRSIDQNTELKVCLKSKNIQITVIQAQPDNMSAVMKEQKENSKRNNIKIYIEKIQNAKMDGYIKGLFYDVVSLFAHLKFTDQLQFMVVKNQKKIISLNDNKDMHLKKYQNQEYYQHFLNFYKHQILPGDRFVKSSCSIRLSKISTQQNKKELIKENKYKIQELKIQQLIAKNEQLQAKVKKYISENKGLQQNIQNLNKIIHFYENENQSQEQTIQIKRNQIQLHKHNHYYEEQEQKKDRKKRKRIKKQIQKNISMKRESQIMPIERMTKNIQDIQEEKKKKLEEQNFFQDENQFVIEKSIKENIRQHIQDQKILKKEEQANLHEIISQNIKKPLDFSFNNHKSMLKLNYQPKPNPVEFQLSEETQKHSKGNLNLINKHIELKESPRKIIISGDSYLKISQQVQLISVPCKCLTIHFQST